MYRVTPSLVTGLCFLPLVVLIHSHLDWNFWIPDQMLRYYDSISQVAMLCAAASSQWPFANISIFATQLPDKDLTINFYAHPKDSIMSFGSLLLRIVLGGLALTSMLALCVYSSPAHVPTFVYALFIAVYVWAGAWFFLTQRAIHKCMLDEKRENLKVIASRLMRVLKDVRIDPSAENRKTFEDLERLHRQLNTLPEWPFRSQTVLTLVTGIIVPVAVMVINLLMKR